VGLVVTGDDLNRFLSSLDCSSGGRFTYYAVLRTFYRWLYSRRSGYGLNPLDNPILAVDTPKVERKILPSLTPQQLDCLLEEAVCLRDKAIISLFADSGLRLSELATIDPANIDWTTRLIKVRCKGGKDGLAVFGERTERLLTEWLATYHANGTLWDINKWGISVMLQRLKARTGLPCNAHSLRRSFASILAKRGVDSLHVMRLGRWTSLAMVDRYTKSVRFEDSLKLYTPIMD
jgi:site-specific recombinase XerD